MAVSLWLGHVLRLPLDYHCWWLLPVYRLPHMPALESCPKALLHRLGWVLLFSTTSTLRCFLLHGTPPSTRTMLRVSSRRCRSQPSDWPPMSYQSLEPLSQRLLLPQRCQGLRARHQEYQRDLGPVACSEAVTVQPYWVLTTFHRPRQCGYCRYRPR